jgi:hypothetical protein
MTLTSALWQVLSGPDGVNQVAKNAAMKGHLVVIGRGAILPYFDKKSKN